jgi:hypothetical protein
VENEVLTKTQENFFGSHGLSVLANDAVGRKRDLEASHNEGYFNDLKRDNKVDNNETYETYLHGMDEVIESTEQQKGADEAQLKSCLGTRGECK